MRVVREFYTLTGDNGGRPPSARELSRHMDMELKAVYEHLRRGVEYGLIKHQYTPGSTYGKRGFYVFLPMIEL